MAVVPYTCPNIDGVIKNINCALKSLYNSLNTDDAEIKDTESENAINELRGLEDTLEDLRKSNSTLREYGEEQEEIVDKIRSQFDTFKEAMNDLV